MSNAKSLRDQWLAWDPNEGTRAQVEQMTDDEIQKNLGCARIAFGTAGLRAEMGAGYGKMNDLVVTQTAQGLLAYCSEVKGGKPGIIVLGYDHRARNTLNSKRFAEITANVFHHGGWKVYLPGKLTPTPFVPFGIKHFKADVGVMVTASHNPKNDNGYKVYWSNACQIIEPHDENIAQAILKNLEPKALPPFDPSSTIDAAEEIAEHYYAAVLGLKKKDATPSNLKIVYTAMHGVGHEWAKRSFSNFGLDPFYPVDLQVQPDPEFPTVAFPNPEEGKGALQLSFDKAKETGATLVLANDPDADRLAVAEFYNNEWRVFTGNEIAALLGCWELEHYKGNKTPAFVASTVSSKFLQKVAHDNNIRFDECLTGFKWIGNTSIKLREQGYDVIFAFEEAIGFCVGDVVPDKDGICAIAVFAQMANHLHSINSSCSQRLDELQAKYGYFCSNNYYVISHDTAKNVETFNRLRYPEYIKSANGYEIVHVRDLLAPGYDSKQADKKPVLPTGKDSQMLTFYFANGTVATLRMSGTEPKLKYYTELSGPDRGETQAILDQLVEKAIKGFMLASK